MSPVVMLSTKVTPSGVTTQKISKGITFYVNECMVPPASTGPAGRPRPLLLMLPWLGSHTNAQAKYFEMYLRAGFDVLVVESNVSTFLWPRWGLEYSLQLLDLLESERFSRQALLIHAFSIGGYTFAQLLFHLSRDVERYRGLTNRIQGQIYDSLVIGSLEHMAIGVSRNVFPRFETLVRCTSLLYFQVFKRQTVDYFNTSIDAFRNTPVTAPALFFSCDNDALSDPESLQELQEYWRRRGITVVSKRWAESIHAGHLRVHPQEYLSFLDNYLCSLKMTPLKAKM
ncbi:transmembrane protein 53 isoform X2 [Brachyhypopomus gauderio]|uniref:transmembrane protein 53 isoform X2 n=1 Tax=Brachyhypopomus gauderio TaxID=698409 RepID=UPI004041BCD1